jgi:hypothetical protein
MKTAENIKKVALVFFLVLGIIHIISGLMMTNGYFMPTTLIINRIMDIPFAMSALLYGISVIYTNMSEKKHKMANIAFILISVLVFGLLIYINLFIPDKV